MEAEGSTSFFRLARTHVDSVAGPTTYATVQAHEPARVLPSFPLSAACTTGAAAGSSLGEITDGIRFPSMDTTVVAGLPHPDDGHLKVDPSVIASAIMTAATIRSAATRTPMHLDPDVDKPALHACLDPDMDGATRYHVTRRGYPVTVCVTNDPRRVLAGPFTLEARVLYAGTSSEVVVPSWKAVPLEIMEGSLLLVEGKLSAKAKIKIHALSSDHNNQLFQVRFRPIDPGIRNDHPDLEALTPPFMTISRASRKQPRAPSTARTRKRPAADLDAGAEAGDGCVAQGAGLAPREQDHASALEIQRQREEIALLTTSLVEQDNVIKQLELQLQLLESKWTEERAGASEQLAPVLEPPSFWPAWGSSSRTGEDEVEDANVVDFLGLWVDGRFDGDSMSNVA